MPELLKTVPYDPPFQTDVYIIGALFLAVFFNVEMMAPLAASMTTKNPAARSDAVAAPEEWRFMRTHPGTSAQAEELEAERA